MDEVFNHIYKMLMGYEMIFLQLVERIERGDKIQESLKSKVEELSSMTIMEEEKGSNNSNNNRKERREVKAKTAFSKKYIEEIEETVDKMKANRMGGIHLFNENYMRGL